MTLHVKVLTGWRLHSQCFTLPQSRYTSSPLSKHQRVTQIAQFPSTSTRRNRHLSWFLSVSPRLLPLPRTRCMRSRMWWALQRMGPWAVRTWRSHGWWAGCSRLMTGLSSPLWREPSVWPVWDWTLRWWCQRLWWTECFLPLKKIKVCSSMWSYWCNEVTFNSHACLHPLLTS